MAVRPGNRSVPVHRFLAGLIGVWLLFMVASGGLFNPVPRVIGGTVAAVLLAWMASSWIRHLEASEGLLLGWLVASAVIALTIGGDPLAAKRTMVVWISAAALWCGVRRANHESALILARFAVTAGGLLSVSMIVVATSLSKIRVGGLFENPNVATAVLLPTAILAVQVSCSEERPFWWRFAAAGCVVGVLLSGSRAGLLALIAAVVSLAPRGRKRWIIALAGLALAATIMAIRFSQMPDVLAWQRPAIWKSVLATWETRPLTGIGPGNLADAVLPFRPQHPELVGQRQMVPSYAESTPFAVLVQGGVVGALLVVAWLVVWLRSWRRRGGLVEPWPVAALVAVSSLGLFHDVTTVDPVLWWWATVFALMEAIEAPLLPSTSTLHRGLRLAVGCAVAWVVLWGIVQPAEARRRWEVSDGSAEAVAQAHRGEPWFGLPFRVRTSALLKLDSWSWQNAAEALAMAEAATRIHPGEAAAWADLGRTRLRAALELSASPASIEAARAAFAESCRRDPWVPWTWLERARLERALDQPLVALGMIDRAIEAEPATAAAWLFRAQIELEMGHVDSARDDLRRARNLVARPDRFRFNAYERQLLEVPEAKLRRLTEALE